ncbi:MAG: YjgP/YjgQ family permease [Planctomycetes bacterium]|nr:YjgP/YjgQ family permease [Planctomycetota bacterium]
MRPSALPLGSRLDRYVARLFALSYGAAFFLVVGLFVILDLATKLDGYLAADKNGYTPPAAMVGQFYLLQLPFLYLQMSPYVTLVAGMFTAAKLARTNEIVAGLNAGVSVRRLLLPVYLGAALLALGMFLLREQSTRGLGRQRDLLQDRLEVHADEHRAMPVLENLIVRDLHGRALRLGQYFVAADPQDSEFRDLSGLQHEEARSVILTAVSGRPLSSGRWQLTDGRQTVDADQRRTTEKLPVLEDPRFTPEDVERAWKARDHPMDLSYSELADLQAREPTNLQYRTLLQYNLTFPLAGLVLLLVGLPFVVGDERGKAGERIARGFLLCVGYFGIDFIARTLGLQGAVGPIFSGWLPVVLFGSLGSVLTAAMRS